MLQKALPGSQRILPDPHKALPCSQRVLLCSRRPYHALRASYQAQTVNMTQVGYLRSFTQIQSGPTYTRLSEASYQAIRSLIQLPGSHIKPQVWLSRGSYQVLRRAHEALGEPYQGLTSHMPYQALRKPYQAKLYGTPCSQNMVQTGSHRAF